MTEDQNSFIQDVKSDLPDWFDYVITFFAFFSIGYSILIVITSQNLILSTAIGLLTGLTTVISQYISRKFLRRYKI